MQRPYAVCCFGHDVRELGTQIVIVARMAKLRLQSHVCGLLNERVNFFEVLTKDIGVADWAVIGGQDPNFHFRRQLRKRIVSALILPPPLGEVFAYAGTGAHPVPLKDKRMRYFR